MSKIIRAASVTAPGVNKNYRLVFINMVSEILFFQLGLWYKCNNRYGLQRVLGADWPLSRFLLI
uniref:Uncharacterized protein n=1 Tax=Kalanchoe fedtschenkoi TaxID=63787 RepID=A0A7N0ZRP5_KALFE